MGKKRKLTESEITRRLNEISEAEPELVKLDPVLDALQLATLRKVEW